MSCTGDSQTMAPDSSHREMAVLAVRASSTSPSPSKSATAGGPGLVEVTARLAMGVPSGS